MPLLLFFFCLFCFILILKLPPLIPAGEEMNFTELLKSFGLDMASVASALGIDIHTLNSMGNDELLLILTQ